MLRKPFLLMQPLYSLLGEALSMEEWHHTGELHLAWLGGIASAGPRPADSIFHERSLSLTLG